MPIELALDAGYDGIVAAWFDAREGTAIDLNEALAAEHLPSLLAGSPIEIASTWTPSAGENDPKDVPMDLGTAAGGPERALQLFFVRGDVVDGLAGLRRYTDRVEASGLADVRLVSLFFNDTATTEIYTDQLW